MGFYLSPHEQDPYAVVKDGKLTKPMFDVVLLQGYSAAAVSKKRLPYFEKYAAAHAETIRNAGSTPMLVMTWTKQDKPGDIRKLADNTITIANKAGMRVVPVGLAFAEVRKLRPELVMYMPDKSHDGVADLRSGRSGCGQQPPYPAAAPQAQRLRPRRKQKATAWLWRTIQGKSGRASCARLHGLLR